jgi:hypothetical protein
MIRVLSSLIVFAGLLLILTLLIVATVSLWRYLI